MLIEAFLAILERFFRQALEKVLEKRYGKKYPKNDVTAFFEPL